MTKDEAFMMAIEALDNADYHRADEAIVIIKEALAQQEQEPVAWGVFEGNLHDMFFSQEEAQEMADLKGTHAEVRPLYTTPPQRTDVIDQSAAKRIATALGWTPPRTWVGLTLTQVKLLGEGVQEEAIKSGHSRDWVFYTHINEALKEKNCG
jgi:hypothetical protein